MCISQIITDFFRFLLEIIKSMMSLRKVVGWLVGWLIVWVYGILTFVGYLMPNPFLYK